MAICRCGERIKGADKRKLKGQWFHKNCTDWRAMAQRGIDRRCVASFPDGEELPIKISDYPRPRFRRA